MKRKDNDETVNMFICRSNTKKSTAIASLADRSAAEGVSWKETHHGVFNPRHLTAEMEGFRGIFARTDVIALVGLAPSRGAAEGIFLNKWVAAAGTRFDVSKVVGQAAGVAGSPHRRGARQNLARCGHCGAGACGPRHDGSLPFRLRRAAAPLRPGAVSGRTVLCLGNTEAGPGAMWRPWRRARSRSAAAGG